MGIRNLRDNITEAHPVAIYRVDYVESEWDDDMDDSVAVGWASSGEHWEDVDSALRSAERMAAAHGEGARVMNTRTGVVVEFFGLGEDA